MHLPPLSEVISNHKLTARRSLGQNYILDLNLTRKIARTAGDLSNTDILEIGPGPGGLTRALLIEGAQFVVTVEKDERFRPALQVIKNAYPHRVSVWFADGLKFQTNAYLSKPYKIVANLPYNVAPRFLVNWLTSDCWPPPWSSLTLMLQEEVAERLVAQPSTKSYGRLSVLCQLRSTVKLAFKVPARAFTPVPKVNSIVVNIIPQPSPLQSELVQIFEYVVKLAFNQRRKMLRSSLQSLSMNIGEVIELAGLDPQSRAENLTALNYVTLVSHLHSEGIIN